MSLWFPDKRGWEVSSNGDVVAVKATLASAADLRELIVALEAYIVFFEQRDSAPASCDTHPKDGDVQQAPLVSGAVGEAETPTPSSSPSTEVME